MNLITNRRYRAGVALETSLILFPVILILTTFLILFYAKLMALNIRFALENTAEEMGAMIPLADLVLELTGSEKESILEGVLQKIPNRDLQELAREYVSSLLIGPIVEKRVDYWLSLKRQGGGVPIAKHNRQILLSWDKDSTVLKLSMFVYFDTLFGEYTEEFSSFIPIWSKEFSPQSTEEGEQEKEDSDIWSQDNFTRGRYFREKEGANLPLNYPVIAFYSQGVAKSIRSVDLTAPSYSSPEALSKLLNGDFRRLAEFNHYSSHSDAFPDINPGDIREKQFILVVPKNMPEKYNSQYFSGLRQEAENYDISLIVRRRGESRRYGND